MASTIIQRHFEISGLHFRDFWVVCSHFQTVNPDVQQICYSIDRIDGALVKDEPNVAEILKAIDGQENDHLTYTARFYEDRDPQEDATHLAELKYQSSREDSGLSGLYLSSDSVSKANCYRFEQALATHYPIGESALTKIQFGKPCEVLALVIDIRGFSQFCEEPNIESPYTCGLMSAFYNATKQLLASFQPELVKCVGDGVIAIWETTSEDRSIAVEVALKASLALKERWALIRANPQFTHGAPEGIGAGLSFGLASLLDAGNDYIGRPINIASRLCSAAPAGRVYVDKTVPDLPVDLKKHDYVAHIKPYGRHNIWAFMNEDAE